MHFERKIRALIVDDSALMRQLLTSVLQQDPHIDVVGTAPDPMIAREKIKALNPDVLTLDIEMPGMDGITFLEKLMRLRPMPVVMVSSHTAKGAEATLRALELGAVDFVAKPKTGVREGLSEELIDEIRAKVRAAAGANVRPRLAQGTLQPAPLPSSASVRRDGFIVIGASAGGTQAIAEILAKLPADAPGIAIVQHMPARFTASFAARLHQHCRLDVREARDGDRLSSGVALVAPGDRHMAVLRAGAGYAVRTYEGEPVNRHRPSVDVLFESAARVGGADVLGIILTGMGNDGARGLQALRQAGAYTIAQDEKSCVVFGMPEQAIRLGGACTVLPLERIADEINDWTVAIVAASPQANPTP